ncbi:MAG: PEP-utilizing enzyme [Pseudomonadota bacterium]
MGLDPAAKKTPFVILGAGKPHSGNQHSALCLANGQSRVLDWTMRATEFLPPETIFVCGYQAEEVRAQYPEFTYCANREWQTTGSGWSLLCALDELESDCIVSYSDILFRELAAEQLMSEDADVVVAVDSHWRTRYAGRSEVDLERCEKATLSDSGVGRLGADIPIALADAEFVGLVKLSAGAVAALRSLKKQAGINPHVVRKSSLADLIELLRMQRLRVRAVDVVGDWAELNEAADVARFVLGTKAQTLQRLRGVIQHARIEDQVSFTVEAWQEDPAHWLEAIRQLDAGSVVVRSSALSEDGFQSSNAGAYTSLLDVSASCQQTLRRSVDDVIQSYPDGDPANEVLVQPMLSDVVASGVVFTRALASGAPYYVANYDVSGSTESITSGVSREHKTLVLRRDAVADHSAIPESLKDLLPTLREIEALLAYDSLDVEFAVTEDAGLHILQVRPIAVDHSGWGNQDARFFELLGKAASDFAERQTGSPFVQGQRTVFGVMPDWNPAEIIGTKPDRLASSLYRYLITDDIWARQRAEYGYRDVRPHPLLAFFAGHPYVDVRASLNSFLPAEVPDSTSAKIVDACLDWLQANPELHDKLEFDVVPTCFGLDFARWEAHFRKHSEITDAELAQWRESLLSLTRQAVTRNAGDLRLVDALEQRFTRLVDMDAPPIRKAMALLDDAREYGTLPFAHLARSAFVAVTLLRSAVATGILTQAELDDFLNSLHTVSHAFAQDSRACANGELEWSVFVERYGHLRPGTYSITSASYRQDPERYLRPAVSQATHSANAQPRAGQLWASARDRFTDALNAAGIPGTPDDIETFMREAIEGREAAKFSFTRNLSAALDCLRAWGDDHGIDSATLAQVSITELQALEHGQLAEADIPGWFARQTVRNAAARSLIDAVELPPLLCRPDEFKVFEYPATLANYIGNTAVTTACVDLESATVDADVAGRVVMIPQADPGYDWLFGRGIRGLVTMYGGANSHMAIRAAEFGLPAAIGIGEVRYRELVNAKELELDPVNRTLRALH